MRMKHSKLSPALLAILAALTAATATARDGQIDLKLGAGATNTIAAPGSYVVVDNVTMTVNLDCITVSADDVTIDLNGHTIAGTAAGAGNGINAINRNRVKVFNGVVRNFGGNGVNISGTGFGADVHDVTVQNCGANGIFTGDGSSVTRCSASFNDVAGNAAGITVGNRCLVQDCVSQSNASGAANTFGAGIVAQTDGEIRGNVCVGNNGNGTGAGTGIFAGAGSLVENNTCSGNTSGSGGGGGIQAGARTRVLHNVCENNSGGSGGTNTLGINAGAGSLISGNTVANNTAVAGGGPTIGINAGAGSSVLDNAVTNNDATGTGSAFGINTQANCVIERNLVDDNDGGVTNGSALGISSGANCRIVGNTSTNNSGGGGNAIATGITASTGCSIIGNVSSNNDGIGIGSGTGISAAANCRVEGNVCDDNDSGAGAGSNGIGITVGAGCHVINNTCSNQNSTGAAAADAIGIQLAGANCVARGNVCVGSGSTAGGRAIGILAAVAGFRIEGNSCSGSAGTTANNFGILTTAGPGIVTGNTTFGNGGGATGKGISLSAVTVYRAANLVQVAEGIVGGVAGTVPGGADTTY